MSICYSFMKILISCALQPEAHVLCSDLPSI